MSFFEIFIYFLGVFILGVVVGAVIQKEESKRYYDPKNW